MTPERRGSGSPQGYHLPLIPDLLCLSPPLTLSEEVGTSGSPQIPVWPWGAISLLQASLSSLQSLGDDMPDGTAQDEDQVQGMAHSELAGPRERGAKILPCPSPSQHHTSTGSKPWTGQHLSAFHIWGGCFWLGPKGLTGTCGLHGCQPSFESKGLHALMVMNLQAASPRPKRRPHTLAAPSLQVMTR